MEFKTIDDVADIMLTAKQGIRYSYSYNWGDTPRRKNDFLELPMNIHAKDFFKLRQNALRKAYAKYQHALGGERPTLVDIRLDVF